MSTPENPVESRRLPILKPRRRALSNVLLALRLFAGAVVGGAAIVSPIPYLVRPVKASPMVDGPLVCVVDGSFAPSEKNPHPLDIDACSPNGEIARISTQEAKMFESIKSDGLNAED